jgi:uncharacterized protein YjgD (DUF1641 family)
MAQAIQNIVHPIKTEAEREVDRLAEVRKQTATDADGLIEGLKLLQAMHDRGILELLVALFDRGDKVMKSVVDILGQPGATNTLKTAMTAMQTFSQYDPAAIMKYLNGFSAGVENALGTPTPSRPLGVFELMRQLKDPDVSAAVGVGLAFLKGVGQALRNPEPKEGEV